jgi:hypothetical protein
MNVNIETGRELDSSQHVHSCLARNERALISTQLPPAYQQAKAWPSSLVPDVSMRGDVRPRLLCFLKDDSFYTWVRGAGKEYIRQSLWEVSMTICPGLRWRERTAPHPKTVNPIVD